MKKKDRSGFRIQNSGLRRDGLVFSTAHGRMCPSCSQPIHACTCKQEAPLPSGDGIVRVSRETKGRKGKGVTLVNGFQGVTVVTGLPLTGDELKALALKLKQRCGAGGTIKNGVIEIQGEHRDLVVAELTQMGYNVKRAGG